MRILIAEDEEKTADFIRLGFEEQGHTVEVCTRGDTTLARACEAEFDAIILDIMLPGRDGLSVLGELRRQRRDCPVLLLTARGALNERLEGFEAGADDYLVKPFYIEELIARVHTLVRRNAGQPHSIVTNGPVTLNLITREATCGDTTLDLTAREFALLEQLVIKPNRVLSRAQLYAHVWNIDYDPGTNLVDVYIKRLREKMRATGLDSVIETVRGVGYRMPGKQP